jgi:hypothetical protein
MTAIHGRTPRFGFTRLPACGCNLQPRTALRFPPPG